MLYGTPCVSINCRIYNAGTRPLIFACKSVHRWFVGFETRSFSLAVVLEVRLHTWALASRYVFRSWDTRRGGLQKVKGAKPGGFEIAEGGSRRESLSHRRHGGAIPASFQSAQRDASRREQIWYTRRTLPSLARGWISRIGAHYTLLNSVQSRRARERHRGSRVKRLKT